MRPIHSKIRVEKEHCGWYYYIDYLNKSVIVHFRRRQDKPLTKAMMKALEFAFYIGYQRGRDEKP